MVKVRHNQTLIDIAVQEYGTPTAVVDLAVANGIGITDTLTPASSVTLPTGVAKDNDILAYYHKNSIHPATRHTENVEGINEGIGYWAVGIDFVIS